MKIIMTKGLLASGKSTWAKDYQKHNPNTVRVNKDELRAMLHNSVHSKGRENFVLAVRDAIVMRAISEGHDVIVDDTNFNPIHQTALSNLARILGAEFEVKDFTDVPLEECIKRDQKRANYVGEKVIKQMYNQYLKPVPMGYFHDPKLPEAFIFDIDGTLAIMKDRGPFEWTKVYQDELNIPVANLLKNLAQNYKIIILSGRDGICRADTLLWLKDQKIPYHYFFMREIDNTEKDAVIKKRIYKENIKGKFNIIGIVDDRKQVKEMWVQEGLFVFDVNQLDEEY